VESPKVRQKYNVFIGAQKNAKNAKNPPNLSSSEEAFARGLIPSTVPPPPSTIDVGGVDARARVAETKNDFTH
jgi:hypothetical protein